LASPEGQQNLEQIKNIFLFIFQTVSNIAQWLLQNIQLVKGIAEMVIYLKTVWTLVTAAVKIYDTAVKIATISTRALKTALVTTGIGAAVVALGFLAEAWMNAQEARDNYEQVPPGDAQPGVPLGPGLGPNGETWLTDGYNSFEEWQMAMRARAQRVSDARKAVKDEIVKTAKRFRDAVGLAFGTFGKDENSVFNVDVVIDKLKRMVDAAKGFKDNLAKLVKQGAGQDVIQELINMGPAQGNIVAKGLLNSGRLSEYLGLRGSLYKTGTDVGTISTQTPEKTYNININKANVTAQDIITVIRNYEKKTGRKYFAF
jgi:hypothetical protein